MGEAEEPGWYMSEYVELAPGTEVYVTDRDHPAWDSAGLIKKAPRRGSGRTFVVGFDGASDLSLGIDQIAPTVEEWKKPEALARRRLHQMRVFLCHGSEDKAAVRSLYDRLVAADLNPWLDEVDIAPGQDWDREIRNAVRGADIVLVMLSAGSVGKTGYVQKEIRFALDRADEMPEGKVYIIPVKLEDVAVPERLRKWQWIGLHEPDGYARLFGALRRYAAENPQ